MDRMELRSEEERLSSSMASSGGQCASRWLRIARRNYQEKVDAERSRHLLCNLCAMTAKKTGWWESIVEGMERKNKQWINEWMATMEVVGSRIGDRSELLFYRKSTGGEWAGRTETPWMGWLFTTLFTCAAFNSGRSIYHRL